MSSKRHFRTLFNLVKQLAFIILITVLVSVLLFQTYDINDISMEPTFDNHGNRVIVFLMPYIFGSLPDYGQIVIIDSRTDRNRTIIDRIVDSPIVAILRGSVNEYIWVKRVIGLPGDTLEYAAGRVYRNGEVLIEKYLPEAMAYGFEPLVVPDGHIYVMGDNRNYSSDSRVIGPVPVSNIQGRVILRLYPFDKIETY